MSTIVTADEGAGGDATVHGVTHRAGGARSMLMWCAKPSKMAVRFTAWHISTIYDPPLDAVINPDPQAVDFQLYPDAIHRLSVGK